MTATPPPGEPWVPLPRPIRMNKARWIAALAIIATISVGCGTAIPVHPQGPRGPQGQHGPTVLTGSQVATLRAFSSGDTAFGLNLLGAICHSQPGSNVVLSPLSVASGLGLAFLGARSATATAMAGVMHLPDVADVSLEAGLRARNELLGSLAGPGVTFAQSNRIWADPSLPTNASYLAALRTAYRASLSHVPLLTSPELARSKINAAVAADTHGHVPDLLPPGSLDGTIGWVLTNALYLKAAWAQPFDPSLTAPGSFSTGAGQVTAQYLNGDGYTIASDGGWTAASLPYRGDRLRMLALLPPAVAAHPEGDGELAGHGCPLPDSAEIAALETRLSASQQTAAIALPKVKLAWSGSLRGVLSSLGMGIAFTSRADFTGISPKACCIGFVQHAATLQVAEKGTVASAATGVGVSATAARVAEPTLRFDRPYLILIEDSRTGEPLMLAWVANPAAS
jgi:serpin B